MNSVTHHTASVRNPQGALDATRSFILMAAIILGAVLFSFRFTSFLHAKELAIYVLMAVFACLAIPQMRMSLDCLAYFLPLWLFTIAAGVTLFLSDVRVPSDSIIELARWTFLLTAAPLICDLAGEGASRARIESALASAIVVVAVLGIIQYFQWATWLFPVFPHYAQRVYSVFGNQDLYGGFLAMGIPLVALKNSRFRAQNAALLFIVVFALTLSGSRSAWLAALLGLLLALAHAWPEKRKSVHALVITLAAVLAGTVTAPEPTIGRVQQTIAGNDEGLNARRAFWHAGWKMFQRSPLLGIGLGNYAYASPSVLGAIVAQRPDLSAINLERHADHPHSEPVRLTVESGLLGMLCWLWMTWRLIARAGPERASLAAFGAFALFNGAFLSIAHTFFALLLSILQFSRQPAPVRPTRFAVAAVAAVLALGGFLTWAVVWPSALLQAAQDAQAANRPALALYQRAVRHPWPSAEAHKNYGMALAAAGQDGAARRELAAALEGLDTGDVYLALATVAARQGDLLSARQFAQRCAERWPGNEEVKRFLKTLDEAAPGRPVDGYDSSRGVSKP